MSESADAFLLARLRDIVDSATDEAAAFRGMRMLLRVRQGFRCRECNRHILKPSAESGYCPYCSTELGPDFDRWLAKNTKTS